MTTLAQTQTLLASVVLVAAMASLVWLAMAFVGRLAPRASLAMAGANAASALGLSAQALRGRWPDALAYWPGDLLSMLGFALLGAAVGLVTERQLRWRVASATVAVAGALLLAQPYEGDLRWQALIVSGASAGLVGVAALRAWRVLRAGTIAGRSLGGLTLPLFLIASLMAARCVEAAINPLTTTNMLTPNAFNRAFLWTALGLTLLQNATLAVLVLMRLIARIERLLAHDPLTGVLNRRAFDLALAEAHDALHRGQGYALVMIDMDRFKQLNDTLGHAAGDAALRQLVQGLQPCVREVDRFGRLGGEEFCVLLPDTDIAGAALVAERMRMLVDTTPLRWLEQDWPLSASFGIAEAERSDAQASEVLARADAALYRAKGQGRNVVQA
ncbi:sensor domain-containing diguanylate cyclase [Roseateles sp. BYS87W]|uniref:diguanylate cyclase n=1 Tax=Pelomonas baiyunensis TaxID=3299026 RepID=A0ABW7H0Y0_9BURK